MLSSYVDKKMYTFSKKKIVKSCCRINFAGAGDLMKRQNN